jgi:hypothetical protein
MTKPAAVRAITAIAWIRIAFAILLLALIAHATIDPRPQRGFLQGARAGLLADAGAGNRSGLTSREAGAASFRPVMTLVLAGLLLTFLGRGRLNAARITEGVQLLLTLVSGATLLSLVVLGLLFTPPVVAYVRGQPRGAVASAGDAPS